MDTKIKFLLLISFFLPLATYADTIDANSLLAFKKIFVETPKDNVQGALEPIVQNAFKEVFDRNQRFEMVSSAEQADTVLKTKIEKKSSGIDLEIAMSLTQTGEVFATDKTTIDSSAIDDQIRQSSKDLLKTSLKHIPFYGTVSGREGTSLTLDIGYAHGLKKGDVVQISRIGIIKRHPLLKTIVDVEIVPIGSAEIDQAEETISFAHVHSEIAGESIKRYAKVTAIEARQIEAKKKTVGAKGRIDIQDEIDDAMPRLGYVGLGLLVGGFSSSTSVSNGTQNYSGSSFSPGFKINGELWLTKNWFGDLSLSYTSFSFRQYDNATVPPTGLEGYSSSTRQFSIHGGYRFLTEDSVYGPQLYAKVGYSNFKFSTSVVQAELLSPKSYGGLDLSVGGMLPILTRDQGLQLAMNILLFPSLTEDGYKTGPEGSATAVGFYIGGYYFLSQQLAMRAGFLFESYSADFGDSGTPSSTSQKVYSFTPSLVYYF